ncbi:Na+/H+ antiporter NhaA [Magnetovibrio sp. PR-2]|uniref:Na+/H+ antiporter NhaA n=1 Tax=Magnetovibrio sp. PR-2 TaxID=3120356 RepID=UPI002FCE00F6
MNASYASQKQSFINKETLGGVLLMMAALAALLVSNSPLTGYYVALFDTPVSMSAGPLSIDKPLLLWVNDGLMAIFFFFVGLEIKREVLEGKLSSRDKAALPLVAAVGGMVVPALFYLAINAATPENLGGWAIPAATDIAFALGILALLGPAVPPVLKVLLLGIAIIDDLGAILAIALFYTADLSTQSLAIGGLGFLVLLALNFFGVKRIAPYVLIGLIVWVGVLKSGVHATLAGVLIALTVPMRDDEGNSPLTDVEHALFPWVSYFIMPVFAFANAGVSLAGLSFADLFTPVPLGIALGLFIGKQLGVMSLIWISVKAGLARLPDGVSWRETYGVACLTGIGFTMSLFIGTLAFDSPDQLNAVRLGVLMGSLASGALGFVVLRRALSARQDNSTKAGEKTAPQSLAA